MAGLDALLLETEAIGVRIVDTDDPDWHDAGNLSPGLVRIGVHRAGPLPERDSEHFDILLTGAAVDDARWVTVADIEAAIADLTAAIARQPFAAATLAQVLRLTLALDFDAAILLESFAYATVLASAGFRAWHAAMPPQRARHDTGPRVTLGRSGDVLEIVLARPRGRNAVDAAMRDALVEALDFARLDPGKPPVLLRGEGAVFSVGGDLAEFGQADDAATAHVIRTLRSPARALYAIRARATAQVHGPCVGAGIEIPAAAGQVVARPGTSFRLPEVAMGLIPGAGGTATISRRIGRHRACWMAISGCVVDLATARAWGLVDRVEG